MYTTHYSTTRRCFACRATMRPEAGQLMTNYKVLVDGLSHLLCIVYLSLSLYLLISQIWDNSPLNRNIQLAIGAVFIVYRIFSAPNAGWKKFIQLRYALLLNTKSIPLKQKLRSKLPLKKIQPLSLLGIVGSKFEVYTPVLRSTILWIYRPQVTKGKHRLPRQCLSSWTRSRSTMSVTFLAFTCHSINLDETLQS